MTHEVSAEPGDVVSSDPHPKNDWDTTKVAAAPVARLNSSRRLNLVEGRSGGRR
jgi:hypothetical protein